MKSLYELIHLLLYFYLGIFTYISYTIIFYHQKKFIFIKNIIYFILLSILWIHISNKYNIKFYLIYFIIYLLGYIISNKLFNNSIIKINKSLNNIIIEVNYLIKLIITPQIINKFKCILYKKRILKKYPYLRKNKYNINYIK